MNVAVVFSPFKLFHLICANCLIFQYYYIYFFLVIGSLLSMIFLYIFPESCSKSENVPREALYCWKPCACFFSLLRFVSCDTLLFIHVYCQPRWMFINIMGMHFYFLLQNHFSVSSTFPYMKFCMIFCMIFNLIHNPWGWGGGGEINDMEKICPRQK